MSNLDTTNPYRYLFDTAAMVEMKLMVWTDVRYQGWADRWRMRRDAPLLPWVARPERQIGE